MKFCPRCGTPKTGSFCGGCGFAFAATAHTQPPVQVGVVANGLVATPAEWKVDPIIPTQERCWDGLGWTNNVRPLASTATLIGVSIAQIEQKPVAPKEEIQTVLLYGPGFDVKKNCHNCGEPRKQKATKCSLCDEDL